jgi:hypothetical protein
MSLDIFKQNMLSYMQNQQGISSYADYAKKLTMEYDMAVKRGYDTVNGITVAKGNTELMESTLVAILSTALQQGSGEHATITNLGPAFIAYWTGASMAAVPPPVIPSPGSVFNVATVSSAITDPGVWQPTDIQILIPTTESVDTAVDDAAYTLSDSDIEEKKKEIEQATKTYNHPDATPEQRESAKEYIEKTQHEIDTKQSLSVESTEPVNSTPVVINGNVDTSCPIGLKVVEFAKKDVGILETGTKERNGRGLNYGGNIGGGETPTGKPGRIDLMVSLAGLDNQQSVKTTGEGYYWCASAVTAWWKSAGLKTPPGAAACRNWASWGKKNGTYSKSPKIGAAALYGPEGKEHHIGIVAAISKDGKITTIEGNTGGGGFNRNGCGCFVKTPRVSTISGFVVPPNCK